MSRFGSTSGNWLAICSKNHFHGSLNPMAQYQETMTIEAVWQIGPSPIR